MAKTHRPLVAAILNNPTCLALLWHDADKEAYAEVWDQIDESVDYQKYGAFLIRFAFDEDNNLIGNTARLLTDDEWAQLREGRSPWDE